MVGMTTTATTAALLALLLTALSLRVSQLRMRHKVSFGDGGHKDLLIAARVHGNALEQSLLFVVLLAAAESLGPAPHLLPVALAFGVARVLHPLAVARRWLLLRQVAHALSLLLQLGLAVGILLR
jgi:uncharacterized protein